MNFGDVLNNYIEELGINAKDISEKSGISSSTISRYRKGTRTPGEDSPEFTSIVDAIFCFSNGKYEKDEIHEVFLKSLPMDARIYPYFAHNFNLIISTLNINIKELSEFMHFDPSYLSRLRTGTRNPKNPGALINELTRYIISKKWDAHSLKSLSSIMDFEIENADAKTLNGALSQFLLNQTKKEEYKDNVSDFIIKLNDFNLDDYIREIHFDELKVPTMPFFLPSDKSYEGLSKMKQGELDFLKATALGRSKEPFTMYSDMPMADMAEDLDFGKKWMFGIACCIKKGLHLNMIHNLDRPFDEMMLGLLSWMPIYMTGQVSPYYFKNPPTGAFCHMYYSSGQAILTGECIKNHHDKGRYKLSTRQSDIAYGLMRAELLIKKASPLMDIYKEDKIRQFDEFYNTIKNDPDLKTINTESFKNIKIEVLPGHFAIVEKNTAPNIRFVIHHKKLVDALLNYKSPLL